MMSKYSQIKDYLEPPFLIEFSSKAAVATEAAPEEEEPDAEGAQAPGRGEARRGESPARGPAPARARREADRARAVRLIVEQGKKDYQVQRYKGLGEMTSTQLWETTMDPERRTLLSVKLEDIAETEAIFTTLMGEDVEARRKFIEDNALDVKNLDI